jgi:hypothetical protein
MIYALFQNNMNKTIRFKTDSRPPALGLTNDKDAYTYISSTFDFVATGL